MTAREFDVLIVGNGALGLSLAAEMTARNHENIAVAGDTTRRAAASQAAGAMLGCFGEVTMETLRSPAGKAKFELGLAARKRWPAHLAGLRSLAEELAVPMHSVADTYVVLNAHGADLDCRNFDAMLEALRAYEEPWEEVDPREIVGYEPTPDARALRAVRLPEEGAVDARSVLSVLEARAGAAGTAMLPEVDSLATSDGRVVGARLTDGSLVEAGTTVVAAGAQSARIMASVEAPAETMPMFAGVGFSMIGERTAGSRFESVVRTPNRAFACGLHLVPLDGGREYLGATNTVELVPQQQTNVGDVHFLTDCAMRQLDSRIFYHRASEWRVGNRPIALDGFPLVGWTRHPGLYLLTGTYRDGFHCAPLLAEHVADQLEGRSGELGEDFSPCRAPISTRTVETSIDDFVQHRIAAWCESGARTPLASTTSAIARTWQEQAAAFYDQLGITYGLSPDILMALLAARRDPGAARTLDYVRKLPAS